MVTTRKPIILGIVTAIPIPAFIICMLCALISAINDTKPVGVAGVIFFVFAGLAVGIHTVMFFFYLIKMQNLKSISQNHYLLWLLLLMPLGGQIIFWYLFFWKSAASLDRS
jgi:hypothetical protein